MDVVWGNRDRVEFGDVVRSILKDVRNNVDGEGRGINIGVREDEVFENMVVDGWGDLLEFGRVLEWGINIEWDERK